MAGNRTRLVAMGLLLRRSQARYRETVKGGKLGTEAPKSGKNVALRKCTVNSIRNAQFGLHPREAALMAVKYLRGLGTSRKCR